MDNEVCLLQLCSDYCLFLVSTHFKHEDRYCATYRPPTPTQRWIQINHTGIGRRWWGSVKDCCSFWNTCLDCDHILLRARLSINLTGPSKFTARTPLWYQFENEMAENAFRDGLEKHLIDRVQQVHIEEDWNDFQSTMNEAKISASNANTKVRKDQWISELLLHCWRLEDSFQ